MAFAYGTFTPFRLPFQGHSASHSTCRPLDKPPNRPFKKRTVKWFSYLYPRPSLLTSLGASERLRPIISRACRSVALCGAKSEGRFRLLPFRSPLLGEYHRSYLAGLGLAKIKTENEKCKTTIS